MNIPVLLSIIALLMAMAALWLTWRMRVKRGQVQRLREQSRAALDRQRAALQAMRESAAPRQKAPLPEQPGTDSRPAPDE